MYRQLIIARADMELANQISQASIAFLIDIINKNTPNIVYVHAHEEFYETNMRFPKKLYEDWFKNPLDKIICGVSDEAGLMAAMDLARRLEITCYPIYKDGILVCLGFPPLKDEIVEKFKEECNLL